MSRSKISKKSNHKAVKKALHNACVIVSVYNLQGEIISGNPNEVSTRLNDFISQIFPNSSTLLMIAPDWEIPPPEETGAL